MAWLTLDEVVNGARAYGRIHRRSVRLRLQGLVHDRLVEYVDGLRAPGDPDLHGGPHWRWSAEPSPKLAGFEAACAIEQLFLEPIAEAPTHCEQGHPYADDDLTFPEGVRRCGVCWRTR